MPRTVVVKDKSVVLELTEGQIGLLDRALGGHVKALQAARDMGVISHETFCGKADRARAVQSLVWDLKEQVAAAGRSVQPTATDESAAASD
jgi:hypothetical protein